MPSALDTHIVSIWRITARRRPSGANIQFNTAADPNSRTKVYGPVRINMRDFETSMGPVVPVDDPGVGAMLAIVQGPVAVSILQELESEGISGLIVVVERVRHTSAVPWRAPKPSLMYTIIKAVPTRPGAAEVQLTLRPYSVVQ